MSKIMILCPQCNHVAIEFADSDRASDALGNVISCPHCGQSLMVGCDMEGEAFWYDLEVVEEEEDADNP